VGGPAGSGGYREDPLLSRYGQSNIFRAYAVETRRNYATDIALLLTSLWDRGRGWTEATQRDLEDYEHWRRFAEMNPERIGGSKWNRELAAFTSLYGWAVRERHLTASESFPVTGRRSL
jgi:site-specific recombinase XerD